MAEHSEDFEPLEVECIGGGKCYVGHGIDLVLIATTQDVKFWRNSFGLTPGDARRLAAILLQQADASDLLASGDDFEQRGCRWCGCRLDRCRSLREQQRKCCPDCEHTASLSGSSGGEG